MQEFDPARKLQIEPGRLPLPEATGRPFAGFAPPISNTTYTPNQFFDVCLPYHSRGVVRLVAYMLRKTLGWCDADGQPQETRILTSYAELIEKAGISRAMLPRAIEEAVEGRFIRCVRRGRPNRAGQPAVSALYELRWDPRPEYAKRPGEFQGFYEHEGHRTDIPNQFFDWVVPRESLAVVKVVGSIIRFSIGFQARRGRRRQQVALSYQDIQNYAKIRNRSTLSEAIQHAIDSSYVACLQEGVFDPKAGKASRAAVYGLKWSDSVTYDPNGSKNVPENPAVPSSERFEKRTGGTKAERFEKRTGNGSKNVPEERFEKRTGIEIKQRNKILKQQQQGVAGFPEAPADGAAAVQPVSFSQLQKVGFDRLAATYLASRYPAARIAEQIRWIDHRLPSRNRLGMLRRAIEEDWPEPQSAGVQTSELTPGGHFAACFYAGLAGNPSDPVALPSTNDRTAAERFVERLNEFDGDLSGAGSWGRRFGEFVRSRAPRDAAPSLVLAIRSFGDRFLVVFHGERRAAAAAARERAREEHANSYRPAWLDYLRSEERRIGSERPSDLAEFQEHRRSGRERIVGSGWAGESVNRLLAHFDAEETRLLDFQKFFAGQVLDFWGWDKRVNRESFGKSRAFV